MKKKKMDTEKAKFSGIATLLMVLALATIATADATTVSIPDVEVAPGKTKTVPVMINDVTDPDGVGTCYINIMYNPRVVNVIKVSDANSDFKDCPGYDWTLFTLRDIGCTAIKASCFGAAPAPTGDVKLADVTLKAVGRAGKTSNLNISILKLATPADNRIPPTPDNGIFKITVSPTPTPSTPPDLVITNIRVCWPDNCTICYNITNTGSGTAPAGHSTTLYVDGIEKTHDEVPVILAPGESYVGCFEDYTWAYTPPQDNIKACADSNNDIDEGSGEGNNCLTNIWKCGDVNNDGNINLFDYRKIYLRVVDPDFPLHEWAADVDKSGTINLFDYRKIHLKVVEGFDLNCWCET